MKIPIRLALALCILCSLAGIAAAEETITIPGTGSSQLILREVAAAFMKVNPGVKVEIPDSSGTGGGYKSAGDGSAPLGRVSRKPNEKEAGYKLSYLLFGRNPVGITTHPGVKVKALTWAQARDLFTGTVTNWKAVGGPDLKVRVIARHENEANFMSIKTTIPEWKGLVITGKSKMSDTDPETLQFVAENEGAVGFITTSDARDAGLNIPVMGGVPSSDPAYPILVDMALVYKPERLTGNVKAFADFVFGPQAVGIIKAKGAIPVAR